MKSASERYFDVVMEILNQIKLTQSENLKAAANLMASCTSKGGIIHTFGTGHSHLVGEDVFWRGSTLANIHAILEPSMTGHIEITKSEYMEKLEGAGKIIVDYHRLKPPDMIIIISNSGNNIVPIDVAIESSKRKIKVVAITSLDYANHLKALHPSHKKLKDVADVIIDNCCPVGDAALTFEGLPMKVGAVSTVAGTFIIHSLVAQAVENLLKKGIKPDVYFNGSLMANSKNVEKYNQKIIDKYYLQIRNL
jgi:uncharacterized phosphosugar-binding protein